VTLHRQSSQRPTTNQPVCSAPAGTIQYSISPLVLLGIDTEAMPENIQAALLGLGGFCGAETIVSGRRPLYIRRKSTSAGVFHSVGRDVSFRQPARLCSCR
jgi:hypothetical protein